MQIPIVPLFFFPFIAADLTVMSFNVYHIITAPNRAERSEQIAQWFKDLKDDCPDVLVIQEAWYGDLRRKLCSPNYGGEGVTTCDSDSPFASATPVANPYWFWSDVVSISSGVFILVKKGVKMEWESGWDHEYVAKAGMDKFANKGCQLVKVTKDNEVTYVVGTHTQASTEHAVIRGEQFAEMTKFVKDIVPAGSFVVFAGDMNTEGDEIKGLMEELTGSEELPTYKDNFWTDNSAEASWSTSNTFVNEGPNAWLDWVIATRLTNDKELVRSSMYYQYVRVQSPGCFNGNGACSDLSDHHGVFAQVCRGECANATRIALQSEDGERMKYLLYGGILLGVLLLVAVVLQVYLSGGCTRSKKKAPSLTPSDKQSDVKKTLADKQSDVKKTPADKQSDVKKTPANKQSDVKKTPANKQSDQQAAHYIGATDKINYRLRTKRSSRKQCGNTEKRPIE